MWRSSIVQWLATIRRLHPPTRNKSPSLNLYIIESNSTIAPTWSIPEPLGCNGKQRRESAAYGPGQSRQLKTSCRCLDDARAAAGSIDRELESGRSRGSGRFAGLSSHLLHHLTHRRDMARCSLFD